MASYKENKSGGLEITTPQGKVYQTVHKDGTITVSLSWNKNFVPKYKTKFLKTQKYIDNTVLRLSEPYIPLITGTLIKSGIIGTVVGTGEIQYVAPYSRTVYYSNSPIGRPTGALRGPKWFERMKADKRDEIYLGAKRIIASEGGSL